MRFIYEKTPLLIEEQISELKLNGFSFENEEDAHLFFESNNYYRFMEYSRSIQSEMPSLEHPVQFEEVAQIYHFDSELRILLFSAIEKIELALRAQIIYQYSLKYGSHWHLNIDLYKNYDNSKRNEKAGEQYYYLNSLTSITAEVFRNRDDFIKNYFNSYYSPSLPPSWMCLEIISFGSLSKLYSNLKNEECKKSIALFFGLNTPAILENWIHCIHIIRNICAHHGRLWNRSLLKIKLPIKTVYPFITSQNEIFEMKSDNKIYISVCCILYLLNIIQPKNRFKDDFLNLISRNSQISREKMGFPVGWGNEIFWKTYSKQST